MKILLVIRLYVTKRAKYLKLLKQITIGTVVKINIY